VHTHRARKKLSSPLSTDAKNVFWASAHTATHRVHCRGSSHFVHGVFGVNRHELEDEVPLKIRGQWVHGHLICLLSCGQLHEPGATSKINVL
jgi:hypothetical protein